MHTIFFMIRRRERPTINMVWRVLKEEPAVVAAWTTFLACSWEDKVEVVAKSDSNESSQLPSRLRFLLPMCTMARPFRSMSIDKESAVLVMVLEDLMHQLFRRVLHVREEALEPS